ncbi:hypothetical protein J2Z26_004452 [Bacillus luteolus]|nr:hypothetical protein [Cytobacillus luteolus]
MMYKLQRKHQTTLYPSLNGLFFLLKDRVLYSVYFFLGNYDKMTEVIILKLIAIGGKQ